MDDFAGYPDHLLVACSTQCAKEGYVDKVKQQAGEGCNIHGHVEVNRVAGNMHFAPYV
jgi:hypothetical protein